jgi:hypothetical protein
VRLFDRPYVESITIAKAIGLPNLMLDAGLTEKPSHKSSTRGAVHIVVSKDSNFLSGSTKLSQASYRIRHSSNAAKGG